MTDDVVQVHLVGLTDRWLSVKRERPLQVFGLGDYIELLFYGGEYEDLSFVTC